jgi:tetratricopeptide (TPR) repeat protein
MSLRTHRASVFAAAALIGVIGLTPDALAKKKKKGGGGSAAPPPADSGGGMTFEPETVERKDAEPAKPAPAPTMTKKAQPAPRAIPADAVVKQGPPTKVLERAIKLYDAGDYPMATIELNKVVEGQSGDDEGNKQRAEFFMGRALFKMKFYSASLSYFDRIVQKGPAHKYYGKTLQWLASLSRFLPESAGTLEKIGKYTRQDLDQPALESVKDELYYLLGRYHYQKGNFGEAVSLFSAIPEKSEFYPKAKFFEGVTLVRENKGAQAGEAFKAILRKVKSYKDPDKIPKILKEYEELANLSLGRIFYTIGKYDQSIRYYEKIPGPDARGGASIEWLPSLFEASWAYFQKDGDSKALGNIHSINSPFFETEFYPESYILKAVIYFNRCNYDRSAEAIAEFNAVYPQLRKELEEILAKYPDNAQFFEYILKVKSGEAGLSARLQNAVEGALYDRTLGKNIEYVTELERELKAVEKADPAWKSTAVAGNILQDLTLQKSLAANEAGNLARQRLQALSNEIQEHVKQAIKIEYETLNGQKGQLTAALTGEQVTSTSINPNAKNYNTIAIDDEHQQWPFKGEYWKDELGYYRFKVKNKCGK